MRNLPCQTKKGFTLIEIVIAGAIMAGLGLMLFSFQKDLFVNNTFVQNSLIAESEARGALRRAIAEIRAANTSNDGSYAFSLAESNALTFFSDVNDDGLRERIRYYVASSSLMRGMTKPSGSPYVYDEADEKVTLAVRNLVNSTSSPIFSYYDKNYSGSSSPLSLPVDIVEIRLIGMEIVIDADPVRSPKQMRFESQVTVRNLKDNL